jgi:hypothetical protein
MTQKSLERNIMPNKHFCQGPYCHTRTTQDRFLKSRGVVRGRYAYTSLDNDSQYYYAESDKYFCSQSCKLSWLSVNMTNIEQGRPIEFIRHRRESGGYQKVTEEHEGWQGRPYITNSIKRVDRTIE